MALEGQSELFKIMATLRPAIYETTRRTYRHESTLPFVYEDCAPPGCTWEFDYRWDQEPGDAPMVLVTAARLMTHHGPGYPVKVRDLDGRWVAEIESLISDELEAGQ